MSDECNALQETLGGFGRNWAVLDEAEAILPLHKSVHAQRIHLDWLTMSDVHCFTPSSDDITVSKLTVG